MSLPVTVSVRSLLLLAWFSFWVVCADAASFDCSRVSSLPETTICDDPELSRLDDSLAKAYRRLRENTRDQERVKQEQRAWLTTRNRCPDASCLREVYLARLSELSARPPVAEITSTVPSAIPAVNVLPGSRASSTVASTRNSSAWLLVTLALVALVALVGAAMAAWRKRHTNLGQAAAIVIPPKPLAVNAQGSLGDTSTIAPASATPDKTFCTQCGERIRQGSRFCTSCGARS